MARSRFVRPPREEVALNKLPPFLDGYEALCGHIARGDIDAAWDLAFQLARSARPLKREVLELYDFRDHLNKKEKK